MHLLLQSPVIKDQSLVLFDENYAGLLEPLLKYRDKYLMNYKGQKRPRGQRRQKRLKLLYIGKKLLQATSFSLSSGDEHLLNQRERSSLQRLEIIKLVSSSCWKNLAFLHFQIFHRTQVRTVLRIRELFSEKRFTGQSWSILRVAGSDTTSRPMKHQKLLLRGQAMNRWKQSSSKEQKQALPITMYIAAQETWSCT